MKYSSRRGTVLILIVVMMALLALVGAAYLQVTRLDRESSRITTGNIDTVCDAIVARVQNVLAGDLRDSANGKFFDPSVNINAFDYGFNASATSGTMGQLDDCWLAAATVDGAGNWPHITALMPDTDPNNARYLINWDTVNLKFTAATPGEETVVNGTTPRDSNLANTAANMVDADGDGIPDSRWQWATIKTIGGTQYVMAVRIIDNSALLNLNVAGSAVATDGTYQADNSGKYFAARFWTPADVDLGGFIFTAAGYTGSRMTDLQALLRFRFSNAGLTLPLYAWNTGNAGDAQSTLNFWNNGPAADFTSGNYKTFPLTDERELRYRNGLNDPKTTAIAEYSGAGMPAVMRSGISTETSYNTAQSANYYSTPLLYLTNEPRHQLTTVSGATMYRPEANTGSPNDLLYLPSLWDTNKTNHDAARDALTTLLKTTGMPFGDVGTNQSQPTAWNANDAADQYVACLVDYFSNTNGSGLTARGSRYGMKALPFLTETYVQGTYFLTAATKTGTKTGPPALDTYHLTWTLKAPLAYAIEMVNPFSTKVLNLQHVRLRVNGTVWNTDLKTLTGQTELAPRTGIILYRNGPVAPDDTGNNGDLATKMPFANPSGLPSPVALTNDMPTDADIVVELQVWCDKDDNGAIAGGDTEWVTYARLQRKAGDTPAPAATEILNIPTTVEIDQDYTPGTHPTTLNTDAYIRFIQRAAFCKTTGLNPIAVRCAVAGNPNDYVGNGTTGTFPAPPESTNPHRTTLTAGIGQVGTENKTGSSGATDWVSPFKDPATEGNAALRSYRFDHGGYARYVTDLLRVMWVGPTDTLTYAEVFGAAAPTLIALDTQGTPAKDSVRTRMISLTDVPAAATGDQALPRGQALLDRVTCLYTDKTKTPLMQGRINLNTAPYSVLVTSLPIADQNLRIWVADEIVAYREAKTSLPARPPYYTATSWTRSRGTRLGFASLGELLQLPSVRAWATDNAVTDVSGGAQVAFNSAGQPLTSDASSKDDRVEEVRLAGFLANLGAVRSDVFTAYVIVRGYPTGAFTGDPLESARFIAVFDRSNVKSKDDQPKVLAVFRLN